MLNDDHNPITSDISLADMDHAIAALDIHRDQAVIENWIKEYHPFIIATAAKAKNEYVQIENDEAYSVALMAFVEAIDRYEIDKGAFLPFCRLVITSRVKNLLRKELKHSHLSLEAAEHIVDESHSSSQNDDNISLAEEIKQLDDLLKDYGISISTLADNTPKHHDTKQLLLDTAHNILAEPDMMHFLNTKKRLPLTQIALRFSVSLKTLKSYKSYLITVLLILGNNLTGIKEWIKISKKAPKT
jgi:RNA polymerase sigma factor